MNVLIEKKMLLAGVIVVLLAIGAIPFAYFMFGPNFPESVPSSEQPVFDAEKYQQQTEFFDKFTKYLQENHGGIVEFAEIGNTRTALDDKGSNYLSFKHRYKFIDDKRIISLVRNFGKSEGIQYKIKKYIYKNKKLQKPDTYEIVFFNNSTPWISVKLEWADESLYREKKQIQYTEVTEQTTIDQEEPLLPIESEGQAKLVIVIDDLGNNMEVFRNLLQLDFEITYAVLPQLPLSLDTAEMVNKARHDVMLHLPMQPKDWPKFNPGNGALFMSDSSDSIHQKMESNLKSVPYIVGVNNHMGSAYTQYPEGLAILMKILGDRNLFFMDSKTAPGNIAKNAARANNVQYMSRNIFLDNLQEEEYVTNQLFKAAKIAKKNGRAIAIGHPYPVTYEVLAKNLPVLKREGIEITRVSDLLVN